MPTLLTASWIAPITSPLIRDGGIVIDDDTILGIGPSEALRQQYPDATLIDLGQSLILPGLVNAHTHLELSTCEAGDSPGGSFADWIISIRERMKLTADNLEPVVTDAVRAGARQCIRFGVTCIGDISQHSHITRPILQGLPLRVISFGEVLGLAMLRQRYDILLPRAIDRTHETDRLRIGLTPHAPYTVDIDGYRECIATAEHHRLPLATHLAESPHEAEFLQHHTGPFRDVWEKLGLWDNTVPTFNGGPIDLAHALGLLHAGAGSPASRHPERSEGSQSQILRYAQYDNSRRIAQDNPSLPPILLAHVNYCTDRELDLLATGTASIVFCPRTHAYFRHPPHRWRDMLARGINIAIATDSCASSPDLNLMADLRLLHRHHPDIPPHQLLELVTLRPAKALGLDHRIGSLNPGKKADLSIWPTESEDPLQEILTHPLLPHQTWLDGEPISPA
jgi:aminodeoxyfutalosine deaminase